MKQKLHLIITYRNIITILKTPYNLDLIVDKHQGPGCDLHTVIRNVDIL